MRLKTCFLFLLILVLVGSCAVSGAEENSASVDSCGLRGWNLENGWQYVIMGYYPYEKDGTKAPVLWQVLAVENEKALLYTTYIIDAHQPVECGDVKASKNGKYRYITDYGETDLNVWLNNVMIKDLLEDEPVLAAVTEEKYGFLYPLTDSEMMTETYGFTDQRFYEVRSRWAYATPYTKAKRLYPEIKNYFNPVQVDRKYGTSSYWVAQVKYPGEQNHYLQICAGISDTKPGDNRGTNIGHLSYGMLTRATVGLRLALRLDVSKIQVISGNGSIWDPCRLAYVKDKTTEQKEVLTPPLRPGPTPVPTTPAPVKGRPVLETPGPDVTPVPVPAWAKEGAE